MISTNKTPQENIKAGAAAVFQGWKCSESWYLSSVTVSSIAPYLLSLNRQQTQYFSLYKPRGLKQIMFNYLSILSSLFRFIFSSSRWWRRLMVIGAAALLFIIKIYKSWIYLLQSSRYTISNWAILMPFSLVIYVHIIHIIIYVYIYIIYI